LIGGKVEKRAMLLRKLEVEEAANTMAQQANKASSLPPPPPLTGKAAAAVTEAEKAALKEEEATAAVMAFEKNPEGNSLQQRHKLRTLRLAEKEAAEKAATTKEELEKHTRPKNVVFRGVSVSDALSAEEASIRIQGMTRGMLARKRSDRIRVMKKKETGLMMREREVQLQRIKVRLIAARTHLVELLRAAGGFPIGLERKLLNAFKVMKKHDRGGGTLPCEAFHMCLELHNIDHTVAAMTGLIVACSEGRIVHYEQFHQIWKDSCDEVYGASCGAEYDRQMAMKVKDTLSLKMFKRNLVKQEETRLQRERIKAELEYERMMEERKFAALRIQSLHRGKTGRKAYQSKLKAKQESAAIKEAKAKAVQELSLQEMKDTIQNNVTKRAGGELGEPLLTSQQLSSIPEDTATEQEAENQDSTGSLLDSIPEVPEGEEIEASAGAEDGVDGRALALIAEEQDTDAVKQEGYIYNHLAGKKETPVRYEEDEEEENDEENNEDDEPEQMFTDPIEEASMEMATILAEIQQRYTAHLNETMLDTVAAMQRVVNADEGEVLADLELELIAYVEGVLNGSNEEALGEIVPSLGNQKDKPPPKPKRIKQKHEGWDKIKRRVSKPEASKWTDEIESTSRTGPVMWSEGTLHNGSIGCKNNGKELTGIAPICYSGDTVQELWACDKEGKVRVFYAESGELLYTIDLPKGVIGTFAVSVVHEDKNGDQMKYCWIGTDKGPIYAYDCLKRSCRKPLERHAGSVLMMCNAEADKRVFSASKDMTVCEWSSNQRFVRQFMGHFGPVRDILMLMPRIWTCSDDGTIRIWEEYSGKCIQTLEGHTGPVRSLCNTGRDIWSAGEDGLVMKYNHQAQKVFCTHILEAGVGPILRMSKVGNKVWTNNLGEEIHIWDSKSMKLDKTASGGDNPVTEMFLMKHVETRMVWTASRKDGMVEKWMDTEPGADNTLDMGGRCFEAECEILMQQKTNLVTALNKNVAALWEIQKRQVNSKRDTTNLLEELSIELKDLRKELEEVTEDRIDLKKEKEIAVIDAARELHRRRQVDEWLGMTSEDFAMKDIDFNTQREMQSYERRNNEMMIKEKEDECLALQAMCEQYKQRELENNSDAASIQALRDQIELLGKQVRDCLTCSRDCLTCSRDCLTCSRDCLTCSRDRLTCSRDCLTSSHEPCRKLP